MEVFIGVVTATSSAGPLEEDGEFGVGLRDVNDLVDGAIAGLKAMCFNPKLLIYSDTMTGDGTPASIGIPSIGIPLPLWANVFNMEICQAKVWGLA